MSETIGVPMEGSRQWRAPRRPDEVGERYEPSVDFDWTKMYPGYLSVASSLTDEQTAALRDEWDDLRIPEHSLWPWVLLIVACGFAAGVGLAWWLA